MKGSSPECIPIAPPGEECAFSPALLGKLYLHIFSKIKGDRLWQARGLEPYRAALVALGRRSRSKLNKGIDQVGYFKKGRELEHRKEVRFFGVVSVRLEREYRARSIAK